MKKIMMIAIAAIAAMNVHAGTCSPVPVQDTAWVYQWKFTGKTTTGKNAASAGSACFAGDACTYRIPTSLKIQGYTYACSPAACADASIGFETVFTECNEVFWMTKPYKASFAGGLVNEICHIIGKNKKKAEIQGVAKLTENAEGSVFDFTYAGMGKYDLNNKRLTSASGNFAGKLSQPWAYNPKKGLCAKAGFWRCDTLNLECEGPSVVYGKWSVKYVKAASKKYLKSGTRAKTPSWVQDLNSCN